VQAAFIIDILNLPKKSKILDLCGGYGRLAIPLAKKGFEVYIQDLNKDFLEKAKKAAKKHKVKVETIHGDMRKIPYSNKFDAVINMFTSFGYLENDKEDEKVINAVSKALKPGGKFLLDIINGDWLKRNFKPQMWRKVGNVLVLENSKLDLKTNRNLVDIYIVDLKKCKIFSTHQKLRLYTFNELEKILSANGLKVIKKYGNFNKEKFSSKLSKRIIILAKKEKAV
jgi:2-polyprenyl-3-methyl-5-hydroxy-6-metoxy-1,4-benzoquinol methylase